MTEKVTWKAGKAFGGQSLEHSDTWLSVSDMSLDGTVEHSDSVSSMFRELQASWNATGSCPDLFSSDDEIYKDTDGSLCERMDYELPPSAQDNPGRTLRLGIGPPFDSDGTVLGRDEADYHASQFGRRWRVTTGFHNFNLHPAPSEREIVRLRERLTNIDETSATDDPRPALKEAWQEFVAPHRRHPSWVSLVEEVDDWTPLWAPEPEDHDFVDSPPRREPLEIYEFSLDSNAEGSDDGLADLVSGNFLNPSQLSPDEPNQESLVPPGQEMAYREAKAVRREPFDGSRRVLRI